ncbi:phage holin family protein, partial [Xanthomonas citri pv. citri]|nr:phage holin family protein [Xanthomonas citri pv. citri]
VAAVLAVQGKKDIEKIKGLPQTQETLQEIPETLNPAKETR